MKIKALKGVEDILPQEYPLWHYLEQTAKDLFSNYGYEPLKIPVIEETSLFTRSIGQQTDIISKEMYTFIDKGNRSISLRPEATASVVRAYLEHNYDKKDLVKFYYTGPMFRGEKPQAGRNRQFYQLGVEVLGSDNFRIDAEVIALANSYLKKLGMKNFQISVNSVGCSSDKVKFSKILKEFLLPQKESLCENCKNRLEGNVLRVLDCKSRSCKQIISKAPIITNTICNDCANHYRLVKTALSKLGIAYTENAGLVRGLDYYTKTVFEISHTDLGAQNAIGAGGRYNNLIKELGGPDKGATGFAFGMERLIIALKAEGLISANPEPLKVYAIALGDAACDKLFEVVSSLRENAISTLITYEQKSLKAHMKQANKLKCPFTIILGDNELSNNQVLLRNMDTGDQQEVPMDELIKQLSK